MNIDTVDQHVLMAVFRLHPNAYGVSIRNAINDCVSRRYSFGTIYAALTRLEAAGFVVSRQGEKESRRGGRRKLLFTISAPGKRALDRSVNALLAFGNAAAVLKEA
jgi:PadR family transcriptional regulator PadR